MDFAVIDTETTGIHSSSDRIIEIAIVSMTMDGEIIDKYCTLINPERDVGPTSIHGISATDILKAPEFYQVAGDIVRRIRNKILVGHNLAFDWSFLRTEFALIGFHLPESHANHICTQSAMLRMGCSDRSLAGACRAFGVQQGNSHCALHDALATAALIGFIIREDASIVPAMRPDISWPEIAESHLVWGRDEARQWAMQNQKEPVRLGNLSGMTVCFSGESLAMISGRRISRSQAMKIAEDIGMLPRNSVSSKTDLLVVPDVNSQSSKSRRARELGVTIVDDITFWTHAGVKTD